MKIEEFKNWETFFQKKLQNSNLYDKIEFEKDGDITNERFISKDKNDKTSILVGYSDEKLIFWKFENPLTIGFNEQQDREYFYRYDYTPGKDYGGPGLEFNNYNVNAINSQLENGLNGWEIQYSYNGQIVKSKIFINQPFEYSTTINFEKRSFWKRLFGIEKRNLQEKKIDLSDIFNGLKNKNVR